MSQEKQQKQKMLKEADDIYKNFVCVDLDTDQNYGLPYLSN